jgi:hypothetical protein
VCVCVCVCVCLCVCVCVCVLVFCVRQAFAPHSSPVWIGLAAVGAQLASQHGATGGHGQVRAGAGGGDGETGTRTQFGGGGVGLKVHKVAVPTNMVVFEVHGYRGQPAGGGGYGGGTVAGAGTAAFCEELKRRRVLMFGGWKMFDGCPHQIRYPSRERESACASTRERERARSRTHARERGSAHALARERERVGDRQLIRNGIA